MINNSEVRKHYTVSRGPQTVSEFFWFLLYLPIGLIIFLLRFALVSTVVLTSTVLNSFPSSEKTISSLLCNVFGIQIVVENPKKCAKEKVLISNCVSPLDHLVLHCITGSITPGNEVCNKVFSTGFGLRHLGPTTGNLDAFKKNVTTLISEGTAVHLQPESQMTNGTSLLKFKPWPFTLSDRVQPVAIAITRNYFNFPVIALESSHFTDLFWYMFFPKTTYKVTFLPVVHKGSMNDEEFMEKVRGDIASTLKVELSTHSASDLQEWEKRLRDERKRMQYPRVPPNTTNFRYQMMANQVKEVLPMVPMNTIYTDLAHTRSVDQTITNLLEGRVRYIPEDTPRPPANVSTVQTSTFVLGSSKDALNTAAKSFGKSANERMLSYQERKKILIESARKKYIEKHGLNA